MKLGKPTKFPPESSIGLAQEIGPVGTLQSELYRHMAEDMSAPAVFVADPGDGYRLLHASATCRHFGNSCETLQGTPLPEYIPTLTQAKLKQLWREVGEYNTTSMETDYRLASGSRIAVEITFSLLEHDGRELMVGYICDISERRVLEAERLRLAEEVAGQEAEFRYREIFENVTDGISLLDVVDGERFCYAGINPALARMTGLVPKNILGRFIEATLPEDVARKMIANYRRCVEAGNPIEYEVELERPGGRKTFKSTLIPVRDGLGYIHRIISLTSDITERKQYETALLARAELERRQSQYFAMAPGLFATILLKADGSYAMPFVSDGIRDVFGIEPEAVMQDIGALAAVGHPDDIAMTFRKAEESARNLTPYYVEYRINHPQKGVRWIEVRSQPQAMPDGSVRWDGFYHDITERKRMEAELIRQTNLQRTLLNAMYDVGMQLMVVENGRIIHVGNRKLAYQFGYTDAELGAHPALIDIIHPDDRARVMDYHVRRVDGEAVPTSYELGLLMRDGERREYEVSVAIMPDTAPIRIITVGKDITEQVRLREALAASEREFRTLAQNLPDVMVRYDSAGRFVYVNALFEQLIGARLDEICGKTPTQAGLLEAEFFEALTRQVVQSGVAQEFDHSMLTADGSVLYGHIRVVPEFDVDGQVQYVQIVTRDITERKRQEMLIQQQLEFERRVSYMADHIAGFLYTFRMPPEGPPSFPYVSAGFRDIYGMKPEDVADDMAPLHAMAHPDDRERIEAGLEAAAETLTPFHLECRINHPVNGERWLEFNSTPVLDVDGSVLFHGSAFDVTERKRMEGVLRFIAQRGWHDNGETFLAGLASYLGHVLGMDYVIIDKIADDPANAETVALYANGEVLPNMQYTLKGTPCDNVMEGTLCCHPENIQQLFPEDLLLVDMQAECYAGIPLLDSAGKVIGLIAVLDGKPMENTAYVTSLLQMVATRVAAELEREQSERALAESKQFLNRIIDTIPDPVFVKDREHRWVHLNQAFCQFIGHPLEALLGKSDYDFFPAQEADVFWTKDEAVFESGEENVNEEEFTDHDGNTHFIITKKVCCTDDCGQQILVGSIMDITERKRMEDLLALREQEFRSLAENSPNSIIRYDCAGRIRYLNSVLAGTLGVIDNEVIGKSPSEVWPDGRYAELQRAAAQAVEAETDVTIELHEHLPGGKEIFHQIHIVPERDVAGQVIGTIAFGWDITDLKHYTRSLLEQARLEQQLSGVAASVPGFIFTLRRETDGRNYFPFASAGVEELFGLRPKDIRDDAAVLRARYHPEDLPRVFAIWGESEQSLSPFRIELRIFHPEHGMRWVEIRSTPQRQADGSTEWHGLMIDITERKLVQAAIQRSQLALEEAQRIALIGSWDWDVVRNSVEWSDMAYEIYTPDERPAAPDFEEFKQSVHPDDLEMVVEAVTAALEQDTPFDIEHRVVSRGKGVRTVYAQAKVFRDAHGKPLRMVGTVQDITERRCEQIMEAERQHVFELISHGGELNEILNQVARYVEAAKPGWHCCVLLLDEQQNRLVSAASPTLPVPCSSSIDGVEVCEESGCCGAAALRGERIVIEDISHHVCPKHCQDFASANNLMACWSEPVVDALGNTLGVVLVYLEHAAKAGDYGLALLRHASYLCSIAIERKRLETQMQHQASYDPLTGLPNRRLLGDRLREEIAKAERGGYRVAVLFIDLDRFKEVNDTLGHVAGDGLLVEAAQRIRACVRESDTVARLAGDEFVVILPEVGEIVPQNRVAQCIVESMARSFLLGEHNVYVSASVGIAVYPQDADNAETLISCADQAMYTAKETGRNSFSFFTCGMLELAQQRLQLASDLREALGKGQLEVYYQPIIDVVSGQAVKAEALLRWQHPQHGMVSPDMFIPLAEETGAIHEIGDWVFRQAAGMALQWQTLCAMGNDSPALCQISVNMSPRQFIRGNPDVAWIEHLQAIGLNPEAIVIEITEGLLLEDQSDVLNKLQRFHQSGMQLALDDFGTGYSAMAYLKKFNIDYLKIDRSFVRDLETDPGDRAIAEAIVAMAHRLGLKVIAEGVETEGQCAILTAAGCEYVQGYLHAKSMPTEVFLEYVVGQSG